MKELVNQFSNQLAEAIAIGKRATLSESNKLINNVLITGLGGSGIGGKIVLDIVSNEVNVPIVINNTYTLPKFVNENTLVIVSSYSGNTEETVQALETAIAKRAQIACITSGGKVLEIAQKHQLNHIVIPAGNPPRSMLAYSLTQQFFIFRHYGLTHTNFIDKIEDLIGKLENHKQEIKAQANQIASEILNRRVVIYSESTLEGVAVRLRQQLNENSKELCWHHVFPEMNHNELVGWAGGKEDISVILLRNSIDFERNKVRMEISKEVFKKYTKSVIEINSIFDNLLENSIYLILVGDWISVYLAELKQVDPIEIDVINHLKSQLSKI